MENYLFSAENARFRGIPRKQASFFVIGQLGEEWFSAT
jgi:hypothetical protein